MWLNIRLLLIPNGSIVSLLMSECSMDVWRVGYSSLPQQGEGLTQSTQQARGHWGGTEAALSVSFSSGGTLLGG